MKNDSLLQILLENRNYNTIKQFVFMSDLSKKDIEMCNKTLLIYSMSEKMDIHPKLLEFLIFIANDIFDRILSNKQDVPIEIFRSNVKRNIVLFLSDFNKKEDDFPDFFYDDCAIIILFIIKNKIQSKI